MNKIFLRYAHLFLIYTLIIGYSDKVGKQNVDVDKMWASFFWSSSDKRKLKIEIA